MKIKDDETAATATSLRAPRPTLLMHCTLHFVSRCDLLFANKVPSYFNVNIIYFRTKVYFTLHVPASISADNLLEPTILYTRLSNRTVAR